MNGWKEKPCPELRFLRKTRHEYEPNQKGAFECETQGSFFVTKLSHTFRQKTIDFSIKYDIIVINEVFSGEIG